MNAVTPSLSANLHPGGNVRNEMGLSEGYAGALGEMIGDRASRPPQNSCGVVVSTHSRALAKGLVRGLKSEPAILDISGSSRSVDEWCSRPETRTVEDLLALPDLGLSRWRAVNDLLQARRR